MNLILISIEAENHKRVSLMHNLFSGIFQIVFVFLIEFSYNVLFELRMDY